jgi:hypothetical protein
MKIASDGVSTLVKQIVTWLVNGDFSAVETRSHGVRLSAEELSIAVGEYGRKLILPPETEFSKLDVIKVEHASCPTWSVRFDLWTKEEGRSDLTLECTMIDRSDEELDVEIDNLHVL